MSIVQPHTDAYAGPWCCLEWHSGSQRTIFPTVGRSRTLDIAASFGAGGSARARAGTGCARASSPRKNTLGTQSCARAGRPIALLRRDAEDAARKEGVT